MLEIQELFPRNYFAHKTTYAYLSLFRGCWNIQENLDFLENLEILTYFEPVTVESVRFFILLHFGATEPDLPAFLL